MPTSERLARAEKICGHEFNDKKLLRTALTHPSAVEGEPVGAVILLSREPGASMGQTEIKVTETAAGFIGRQMEQ